MDVRRLTEVFRRLGAHDPEGGGRSQVEGGIPQLARFLFLRQAWRKIVPEDDASWIDSSIARSDAAPNEPYAGVGHALKRLRSLGAADDDLTDLVRGMQASLLFDFCFLLECAEDVEPEAAAVQWALYQLDEEGRPVDPVGGLHESVLEMDPTGREMTPRPRPQGHET